MKINFLYFFLLLSFNSFAQELLTGKITFSSEKNQIIPLEGVNVYWKDSSVGTVSDKKGNYSIPYFKNSKILFFETLGFTNLFWTLIN